MLLFTLGFGLGIFTTLAGLWLVACEVGRRIELAENE
jgi:hypothetical protein